MSNDKKITLKKAFIDVSFLERILIRTYKLKSTKNSKPLTFNKEGSFQVKHVKI